MPNKSVLHTTLKLFHKNDRHHQHTQKPIYPMQQNPHQGIHINDLKDFMTQHNIQTYVKPQNQQHQKTVKVEPKPNLTEINNLYIRGQKKIDHLHT